jgi:hypothetical protein
MTVQLSWKRLIIEGVVIMVSILMAFGVDAAWDARADAAQERALLIGLAEDFRGAADALQFTRHLHQEKADAAEQLLSWAESGGVDQIPAEQVEIAIRWTFARATFNPPMGTIGTILGSGRLDLLQDTELVRELTSWSARVANLRTQEDNASQYLFDNLVPYLAPRINLKDTEVTPEIAASLQWPGKREPTDANLLLSQVEFQSHLFMVWSAEQVVFSTLEPVEAAINRILQLVDRELEQ